MKTPIVLGVPGWVVALTLPFLVVLGQVSARNAGLTSTTFYLSVGLVHVAYAGWLALLASGLASFATSARRNGTSLIRAAFALPLAGVLVLSFSRELPMASLGPLIGAFAVITLGSQGVLLYIAARNLVSAEKSRDATIGESLGTFFGFLLLTLVLPLAPWWLQARAHRVLRRSKRAEGAA